MSEAGVHMSPEHLNEANAGQCEPGVATSGVATSDVATSGAAAPDSVTPDAIVPGVATPGVATPGAVEQRAAAMASSAGAKLAAARQQKNLSVQQVAEQLKLSPRQIAALEADQFDVLPKPVIVRGFVRSYAKLLKIDAEPVLALLPPDTAPVGDHVSGLKPAMAAPFMESRMPLMGRQDNGNRKYIVGGLALGILALGFFVLQRLDHAGYLRDLTGAASTPAASSSASAAASQEAGAATGEATPVEPPAASAAAAETVNQSAAVPMAQGQAHASAAAAAPAAIAVLAPVQAPAPASQAATALGKSVVAAVPAAAPASLSVVAATPPAPVDPANALKLVFKQDSWLQVKRANGAAVTSHLAKAGTQEVFDAKDGLQIRLGNAAGVEGVLRGAPLEIQPPQGSNVVNLNVK